MRGGTDGDCTAEVSTGESLIDKNAKTNCDCSESEIFHHSRPRAQLSRFQGPRRAHTVTTARIRFPRCCLTQYAGRRVNLRPMDSFKALQDSISQALVSTTRAATRLSATDIPFQRSLDPAVGTALDEQNARLLQLAQRLLANAAASSDAVGPKLPDVDAIDVNWKAIIDVVDSLLEKADTSLDEYTGVVKRLAPSGGEAAPSAVLPKSRLTAPATYPKPQLSFEDLPQNNQTSGFRPLLTSKPHAQVSLVESLEPFTDSHGREQYAPAYVS